MRGSFWQDGENVVKWGKFGREDLRDFFGLFQKIFCLQANFFSSKKKKIVL